jgi:hypothetical protein
MAWAGDSSIELEVTPRGHVITFGQDQGWTTTAQSTRYSEVHLAICVQRSESEIIEIAEAAGWQARHCERGNGIFSLCEVWVENSFMIEFLDPAQTAATIRWSRWRTIKSSWQDGRKRRPLECRHASVGAGFHHTVHMAGAFDGAHARPPLPPAPAWR